MLYQFGHTPVLSKADVSKAFRGIPASSDDEEFLMIAYMVEGIIMVAIDRAMPFGAVGAVWGWHRFANVVLAWVRQVARAPALKYVDDFFTATRNYIKMSAMDVLEVLMSAIGVPLDPRKTEKMKVRLTILGARLAVMAALRAYKITLDEEQKMRWMKVLEECVRDAQMDAGIASKSAGQFTWATSWITNKVWRAFIKPLYAQAAACLPNGMMTLRLQQASAWWLEYLKMDPCFVRRVDETRGHVRCWCDAAGSGKIAALVSYQGKRWCTRMQIPQVLMNQFMPRRDNFIQQGELLSLILILGTFPDIIARQNVTIYCDNVAVVSAMVNGSADAVDQNMLIGKTWLEVCRLDMGLMLYRVETKANPADEPTREETNSECKVMTHLQAEWRSPTLPSWTERIWQLNFREDGTS